MEDNMIGILFLLGLAQAADVYEACVIERQVWSDYDQDWETKSVESYYSQDTVQMIIYENTFEVHRKKRNIEEKYKKGNNQCWKEHQNSFFCYDQENKIMEWEFHYRNGKVTRDLIKICVLNGEAP